MKKSIISLFLAIIMVLGTLSLPVMAEETEIQGLSYAEVIAKDVYGGDNNTGRNILENEKYIFVVEGTPVSGFENDDIRVDDVIHIYEKPNSEHLDYKHINSIEQKSSKSATCPIRGIELHDDILYVAWGHVTNSKDSAGGYPSGHSSYLAYVKAYDVSEISEDETISGVIIQASLDQRAVGHIPFIRGPIITADEESDVLLISGTIRKEYATRYYYTYSLSAMKEKVLGIGTVSHKMTKTGKRSQNAVDIRLKDGYLFEILQQKNGLIDYSGDNTLVDSDGMVQNNTIYIFDFANGIESVPDTSLNTGSSVAIESYKRGEYITETAGGVVINDIEVCGDYMYVATEAGLEVVDISEVKSAEEKISLSMSAKLCEEQKVNALTLNENMLYVGTDSQMIIYDVTNGMPELLYSYDYEGGFCDFVINEAENAIYALSAAKCGGALIIDMNTLFGGIAVSEFEFTEEEGKAGYSVVLSNEKQETVSFKTLFAVNEGDKLIDIVTDDVTLGAGEQEAVSGISGVELTEGRTAKFFLINSENTADVLPMKTENGIEFIKETQSDTASAKESDASVNIDELDINGNINVYGTLSDYKNKPVLVIAENINADFGDRLEGYRYINVVSSDENGNYCTKIKPSDEGEYKVSVSKAIGAGAAEKTIVVPKTTVALQNTVEVPGIDSYLYIEFENGQNIALMDITVAFDENLMTAGETVATSDEFEVSEVLAENGKISITLSKKEEAYITTEKNEFCVIPIKVSEDAVLNDYEISLSVDAKDSLGYEINTDCTNATLSLVESTPKYEALNEAKEALALLKDADEIEINDYLDVKPKAEDAREKVNTAYEYFIRDSQLGKDKVLNLAKVEEKLLEIKPYYDAVDNVNAALKETVIKTLKDNKDYFDIDEESFDVYERLEDKTVIDDLMAEEAFEKPDDVMKTFYDALVLEAFKETNWRSVDVLLEMAKKSSELDLKAYNKLTATQKAEAHKLLALTEYESMDDLQDALDKAVSEAKEESSNSGSGSGGSGSGSGGSKKTTSDYYVSPKTQEETKPAPEKTEIFSDIYNYGWAKEAIEYLYSKGVINGRSSTIFAPGENVTREEFAKMIALAFDIKAENANANFSDVDNSSWYAKYVFALADAGIVNGYGDGSFGTGAYITREEIAVILDRVAQFKGIEIKAENEISIKDADEISPYAVSAINKMCASGIISGFGDGTVRPRDNAQRAQTAQLIYKVMKLNK